MERFDAQQPLVSASFLALHQRNAHSAISLVISLYCGIQIVRALIKSDRFHANSSCQDGKKKKSIVRLCFLIAFLLITQFLRVSFRIAESISWKGKLDRFLDSNCHLAQKSSLDDVENCGKLLIGRGMVVSFMNPTLCGLFETSCVLIYMAVRKCTTESWNSGNIDVEITVTCPKTSAIFLDFFIPRFTWAWKDFTRWHRRFGLVFLERSSRFRCNAFHYAKILSAVRCFPWYFEISPVVVVLLSIFFSAIVWILTVPLYMFPFVDAPSHLFMRSCPSVGPSVGP